MDLLGWVFAELNRAPGRATLAIGGVALGAALLVSLLATIQGIQDEAQAGAVWTATPGRLVVTGARLQDPDVIRLANLQGVQDALPVLATPAGLERDGHHLAGGIAGIGLSARGAVPYRLLAGGPLDPARPDIVLSRVASAALGFAHPSAAIGQSIAAKQDGPSAQTLTMTVVGVADELGDQNGVMGLPVAEDMMAPMAGARTVGLAGRLSAGLMLGGRAAGLDPLIYSAILVVPQRTSDVPSVAERLRSAGYSLAGAGQVPPAFERVFQLVGAGLGALSVLASLGSALGVAQVLASRATERTAEIGVLKALGATDHQVAMLVAAEALMLGLAGGMLGVLAGWAAALCFSAGIGALLGQLPSPRLTPELVVLTPLLAMLLALLAAIAPAWHAWRLLPAHALRHS